MPQSALAGTRVIDCTHVIAGAYCSLLLADLGADVIKIEPLEGESNRASAPSGGFRQFDVMNRNKRAIAVDIAKPEGADVVRRLARDADVFVENYRPGVLERAGLGYEALKRDNPGLVYCSVSGFGHSGPYAARGGLDLVTQAMSGIMSFTGEIGSTRPVPAGVPLSDVSAGCFAAVGVLAALNHRRATGAGQKVETTLFESALSCAVWETGLYLATGEVAKPRGSRHRLAAPYEALKTKDGYLAVGVINQRLWSRFCKALDVEELETDPRFAKQADRLTNRDALQQRIEAVLATDTTARWVERILAHGVPCGPVNTIAQAVDDPHIAARGLVVEKNGQRFARAPILLSQTPAEIARGSASVGQHTREVLSACGYSEAEINELATKGMIGVQPLT